MNDRYKGALDLCTYLLANTLSRYDAKVACKVAKWANCIQVQMKTSSFNLFGKRIIFTFLSSVKLACDTNVFHENAALWAF